MPVVNNADTPWTGWLVSGTSESSESLVEKIHSALERRRLPKVETKRSKINMWHFDAECIDVKSTLDSSFDCTIHVNQYGDDLFIGLAWRGANDNYYKQMAAACLVRSVLACVGEVIAATGAEPREVKRAM